MGAGGSSDRLRSPSGGLSSKAAGLEEAVFKQRDGKSDGRASGAASVEDPGGGDYLDISYSEGGGILAPQVRNWWEDYLDIYLTEKGEGYWLHR